MWLTKEHEIPGSVFGSVDRFEGLGIFFDTYKNNRPGVTFPLVMAMMGDGQTAYDQANDGKANELASCSVSSLPFEVIVRLLLREDTTRPVDSALPPFQPKPVSLTSKTNPSLLTCNTRLTTPGLHASP